MKSTIRAATIVLLSFLFPLTIHGLDPVFVLGSGGGASWVKEPGESANLYPYGEVSGTVGYRGLFGEEGYYAASLYGGLRYYGEELSDFADEQMVTFELGAPLGPLSLEIDGTFASSFYNLDNGVSLLPDWELLVRPDPWRPRLTPRGIYFGSYRYEEKGLSDRLVQGARLGVEGDPTIRFGWFADLLAAYERFPDQDATPEGGTRQDGRFSLLLGADGLIGFFTGWEVENETGVRLSNAESPTEDRVFSALDGMLQFSPVQELGIEVGMTAEEERYFDRKAVEEDGTLSGDPLTQFTLSGLLRLDYTPDGALFFVLEGAAGKSFSPDPAFEGWSSRLSLEIEYSF
ncbi:MAG: hypothetical protein ACOC47_06640 [Alkalispirochaetaceae bacterium]